MSREELIALLRSWQDFFPLPPTWTGELQRRSVERGPAPFRRIECPECEGKGNRGRWTCQRCKGEGGYEIDVYTGEPVATDEAPWSELLDRVVNCDTCGGWGRLGAHADTRPDRRTAQLCPRCEGTGKVAALFSRRLTDAETVRPRQGDRTLDALSDQSERRDETRIYREQLQPALEQLRQTKPGTHFLICWTYVLEVQTPTRANTDALERGLAFLLERIEHVRAPAYIRRQLDLQEASLVRAKGKKADTKAQGRRNAEIRRRRVDEGAKLAELADEFDLDKSQVSRILNGAGP